MRWVLNPGVGCAHPWRFSFSAQSFGCWSLQIPCSNTMFPFSVACFLVFLLEHDPVTWIQWLSRVRFSAKLWGSVRHGCQCCRTNVLEAAWRFWTGFVWTFRGKKQKIVGWSSFSLGSNSEKNQRPSPGRWGKEHNQNERKDKKNNVNRAGKRTLNQICAWQQRVEGNLKQAVDHRVEMDYHFPCAFFLAEWTFTITMENPKINHPVTSPILDHESCCHKRVVKTVPNRSYQRSSDMKTRWVSIIDSVEGSIAMKRVLAEARVVRGPGRAVVFGVD